MMFFRKDKKRADKSKRARYTTIKINIGGSKYVRGENKKRNCFKHII